MKPMDRRGFNRLMAGAAGVPLVTPSAQAGGQAAASKRPNILFLCSDQHGARFMESSGNRHVHTPHMSRLAAAGVEFTCAHSAAPVCVPGRASLMTGAFASDVNSFCNSTPFDGRIPTWCNRLRDQGYQGWATGKLDLEVNKDYGFREIDTSHKHSTNPDITSLFRRPLCYRVDERHLVEGRFEERTHIDDPRVNRVLDFLRHEAKSLTSPWFYYVGLELPHHPYTAHIRYKEMYPLQQVLMPYIPDGHLETMHPALQAQRNFKLLSHPVGEDRVRRARAAYFGMVTELDDYLGMILDELKRGGWLENTLVVFTSDHGEMAGEHGLWLKNNLLEDSVRVPLIMAGGGIPQGRRLDTPVSHVDLVATLLEVGGLRNVESIKELRGHSLLPMIEGRPHSHPSYSYSESHSEGNCTGSFMIRKGDWKYIYFSWFDCLLFNLKQDPGEFHNLANDPEHLPLVAELHGILTSLVAPDKITEAAFTEQERRLRAMVESKTAVDFYRQIAGRLGPGQAGALTNRYYKGFSTQDQRGKPGKEIGPIITADG
jgi:choline-sulfatase